MIVILILLLAVSNNGYKNKSFHFSLSCKKIHQHDIAYEIIIHKLGPHFDSIS